MNSKSPETVSVATYSMVFVWSMLGGLASHVHRAVHHPYTRPIWLTLLADLLYSAFAGLLTFYAAQSANIDPMMTAVLVGTAGHMGARLVFAADRILTSKMRNYIDENDKN